MSTVFKFPLMCSVTTIGLVTEVCNYWGTQFVNVFTTLKALEWPGARGGVPGVLTMITMKHFIQKIITLNQI